MASLTVRNIPDEVMEKLRKTAAEESRSVNAQIIRWLEDSAARQISRVDRDKLLDGIRALREEIRRTHGVGRDSGELIREMRDERTAHWMRMAEENRAKARPKSGG